MGLFSHLLGPVLYLAVVSGGRFEDTMIDNPIYTKNFINFIDEIVLGEMINSEKQTCEMYRSTVDKLVDNVDSELELALQFVRKQIDLNIMDWETGECAVELTEKLNNIIAEEKELFKKCSSVALAHQSVQMNRLDNFILLYNSSRDGLLLAYDRCVNSSPAKYLKPLREKCFDKNLKHYGSNPLLNGNLEQCMKSFEEFEIKCVKNMVESFTAKVNHLFKSGNSCAYELEPFVLQPNIDEQIHYCQNRYKPFSYTISLIPINYLNTEINIEMSLRKSRTKEWFQNIIEETLTIYQKTLNVDMEENSDATECGIKAKESLANLIEQESIENVKCEEELRFFAQSVLKYYRNNAKHISSNLTSIGNAAILDCLSNNYLFATNAIKNCYDLKLRNFTIKFSALISQYNQTYKDRMESVKEHPLLKKMNHTFPCGENYLENIQLKADIVTNEYRKCVYRLTGRNFETMGNNGLTEQTSTVSMVTERPQELTTFTTEFSDALDTTTPVWDYYSRW